MRNEIWVAATGIGTTLLALGAFVGILMDGRRRKADRGDAEKRLIAEREIARQQLEEERKLEREREQWSEAHALHIVLGSRSSGIPGDGSEASSRVPVVVIANHGRYAVSDLNARIHVGDSGIHLPVETRRVTGFDGEAFGEEADCKAVDETDSSSHLLAPRDSHMVFEFGGVDARYVHGMYPIARWQDRWEQCWQYCRGQFAQIADDESWPS